MGGGDAGEQIASIEVSQAARDAVLSPSQLERLRDGPAPAEPAALRQR